MSQSATDCSFLLIVAALFEWATDGVSGRTAGDVKAAPLRMWSGSIADILITSIAVIRTAGANGGGVYLAGQAESSGPVGDRYVRLDIALSMASYAPHGSACSYSQSIPNPGTCSSNGRTRLRIGYRSAAATLTYSRLSVMVASITPGIARTRLNRSSESMIAPLFQAIPVRAPRCPGRNTSV